MPLEIYERGTKWWVKGRVEYEGLPITDYYRQSTGSFTEAGATEWAKIETDRQRRRHLLGDEAEQITFVGAIMEYDAKPADAGYLATILTKRPDVGSMAIHCVTGRFIKKLGLEIYPTAATDTIWRQVVTPMRSVINNLHELGKGPYLKVRPFKEIQRIERDTKRGKLSRSKRSAADKTWINAFCRHADVHNAAMVRFMFETGARIDQAVSLVPKDVDLMNKRVRIKAQKGHAKQWVEISHSMMIDLANLPAKRPHNRREGYKLEPRVFGYGSKGGYRKSWKTICAKAGIKYLTAHEAGRHGFGTELLVRQGVDPVTVAENGRWASVQLVLSTYGHSDTPQTEIRERFRTEPVQDAKRKSLKSMNRND